MRIILSIFAGVIIYLLFEMFASPEVPDKHMITKRLDQITRIGDVEGEVRRRKSEPLFVKSLKDHIKKLVSHMVTIVTISDKERERMEQMILQGDLKMIPEEYLVFEIIAILSSGLFGIAYGLLLQNNILYGFAAGALGGYTLFRYYVKARITNRKRMIRRQLPEVVDLLALCVESGLSFNQGIQYVLQKSEGPLIAELETALKRMNLGESRRLALNSMAEHCDLEEVTVFVSSVVQAEELGLPLKNILVTQARQGRIIRRMKVEEEAQKLPIKIMFPLIFLIMPTLFIVLLGPAVPRFIYLFQNM